jgi:tetratricopeptide (TPR) repeat protein
LDALFAVEGAHALRVAALGHWPELGWRVADAHLRLGALEQAEAVAREAVAHDPGKSLLTLGGVLLARGKLDEAVQTFTSAREVLLQDGDVSRAAGARFNTAHVRAIQGELEVAVREARAAFEELDPDLAPALRGAVAGGIATFEMERGRLDQARMWLRRIPDGYGAVGTRLHAEYALGWLEADAGDFKSAHARFQAVCDACGPRGEAALAGDALEARGVMRALGGDVIQGLSDVERATHLHRRRGRGEAEDRARFFLSVLEHQLDETVPVSAQRLNGQGVEGRIARRLLSRR